MQTHVFPVDLAAAGLPALPGRLATAAHPAAPLADHLAALRAAGVDVLVSALMPAEYRHLGLALEPELAANAGLSFVRAPIPDFSIPADPAATLVIVDRLGDDLRAGRSVVCHCRGGIGRSTLLAGATLIRLGADPGRVIDTIAAARGRRVPETRAQKRWLHSIVPRA